MLRREFLLTAAASACQPLVSSTLFAAPRCVEGADIQRNRDCPIPYENNIRDRSWMWGHDSGSLGHYISAEKRGGKILPAAAIKFMGIPNVCMVPFTGTPRPQEYDEYAKQFDDSAITRFIYVELHPRVEGKHASDQGGGTAAGGKVQEFRRAGHGRFLPRSCRPFSQRDELRYEIGRHRSGRPVSLASH